ncbi:MAG TPA: hypothetical protein DEG28_01800 [Porphyromonadaceae bacterium]|nr:hypothetical protein [Porphyromonadaceae bacterium]
MDGKKDCIMRNKFLYAIIIGFTLSIVGCEDTRLNDITPPKVYIPQSGEIEQTVYKTGEPFVFRLGVYKTGYDNVESTASVDVLSEDELQVYNTENNRNYKRIPDNCFQLAGGNESYVVKFSKGNRLEYVDITLDYDAIEQLADFDKDNSKQYVVPVSVVHSNLEINEDKEVAFIKPLIRDPFIYFQNTESSVVIETTSNSDSYQQNLVLAVDFVNLWNISVDLEVNEMLVDVYNNENGTDLKLLPTSAYTISPNPAVIKNGNKTTTVSVDFSKDNIDYDDFLLPVFIKETSRFVSDIEQNVHYVTVSRPAPRLDRRGWTIIDVSSEEPSGEGVGNGTASCVLDGTVATYWHSQWAGGTGQLPHHFTIDMQKTVTVASVDLQRRQDQRDAYRGKIYISEDNDTFTQIGDFEMAEVNEPQTFRVTTSPGRYLKIEITESRRAPYANLAEVYARGVE